MEIFLAIAIIFIIPLLVYRPIALKAGFSGWWALLDIIPIVNIILLWVMAIYQMALRRRKRITYNL